MLAWLAQAQAVSMQARISDIGRPLVSHREAANLRKLQSATLGAPLSLESRLQAVVRETIPPEGGTPNLRRPALLWVATFGDATFRRWRSLGGKLAGNHGVEAGGGLAGGAGFLRGRWPEAQRAESGVKFLLCRERSPDQRQVDHARGRRLHIFTLTGTPVRGGNETRNRGPAFRERP